MRITCIRRTRFNDFFGVSSLTTKDLAGISSDSKLPVAQMNQKYEPLQISMNKLANEEKSIPRNYGSLRFDRDNEPRTHGQFESTNKDILYDTKAITRLYDNSASKESSESQLEEKPLTRDVHNKVSGSVEVETSQLSLDQILRLFKKDNPKLSIINKPPLSFEFDPEVRDIHLKGKKVELQEIMNEMRFSAKDQTMNDSKPVDILAPNVDQDEPEEALLLDFTDEPEVPEINKNKKPINAFEYLKQIRSKKIEPTAKGIKHREVASNQSNSNLGVKLDSTGKYDYSNVSLDWWKMRRIEALDIIRSSIIYDNYDIIAINKPYGISSHDERQKGLFDVNSLMKDIATERGIEKLYLVHRLDKTTTGVLLFARTQAMAQQLNKLFKADLIKKTYWCITRGVPDPEAAIIDIPIGEYTVAKKVRSCLVPERWPKEYQIADNYLEAKRAVTEYCVKDSREWVALVEVKPRSGVKHQIRCHLSHALGTPILGDHKYSDKAKLAPQKLPGPILTALHMRQEKVRTLPIFLHSKISVIPDVKADKGTLFITAPLPALFKDMLKRLKLKEIV